MRIAAWIVIVGFGVCPIAAAQTPSGVVRVSVRVQETSEPVPNAEVTLRGVNLPGPQSGGQLLDLPDNEPELLAYLQALAASRGIPSPPANAVTDTNGNAEFSSIAPGRYDLGARREGYVGVRPEGTAAFTIPSATSVTVVVAADQPSSVSLFLNRGTLISGRLRDADGQPLVNALVAVSKVQVENGQRVVVQSSGAGTTTDAAGQYRLTAVAPGDYVIAAMATTAAPRFFYPGVLDLEKATLISVKAGQDLPGMDMEMPR